MRLVQAIMAIILTAIFLGIVAGVASASVPGVAINAPPPSPALNAPVQGGQDLLNVVVSQRDTPGDPMRLTQMLLTDSMSRQAPMATKTTKPTVAAKATNAAKPTIKRMVTSGDMSGNIPRASYSSTPFISVKPSLKARASPATKYLAVKVSPSVRPTMKPTTKYPAMGRVKPSATVMPAGVKRSISEYGAMALKVSPSVRPTMKPTTKYLAVKASPSAKPTKKPGVKYLALQNVKTPAQSYGIYGLGGPVPSPPASTPTVRAVPSGSPTPVPGSYTPRYPGEAGAGKNVTVPPSPTPVATVKPMMARPNLGAPKTAGETVGPCACVDLASDLRYSGRGPGIVGNSVVQPPASAPGPNTAPTASRIVRT